MKMRFRTKNVSPKYEGRNASSALTGGHVSVSLFYVVAEERMLVKFGFVLTMHLCQAFSSTYSADSTFIGRHFRLIPNEISSPFAATICEPVRDDFGLIVNPSNMNSVTAQAAGSADPPCCPFVPLCFECGTRRNPCHCRILGPTLGFVAFAVAACVEWPVGAFVYCFRHLKGRRIMAHPAAVVYPRVASCLPI